MTYDTKNHHKTRNIEDLSYTVITPEGKSCTFSPTPQGLHVFKINEIRSGIIFGSKSQNNVTIFGGACHALMEDEDEPNAEITGVSSVDGEDKEDSKLIDGNAKNGAESTEVIKSEHKVRFYEAIETVMGSRSKFSKRDQIRADRVRRLQHVAGFPSDETFTYSVMTNGIKNNPISRRDIKICNEMLGKSMHAAKEKRTIKQSDPFGVSSQVVKVPPSIMEHYGSAQLAEDMLHVNEVPFLISIPTHIHYGTANAVDNTKAPTLEVDLKSTIRSYVVRGFSVGIMFLDIQFKCVKDRKNIDVSVNMVSHGKHVKLIERFHRVIEEKCRYHYAMLPYDSLPIMMVLHLMSTIIFYINAFV